MSDRSRVLILTKGLGLGGMERLLAGSLPHLSRDRFEYEAAYFLPWKDDLVAEFERGGVPTHCLDISSDLDPTAPLKVRRLLGKGRFDLIHTHSPQPAAIARIASLGTTVRALVHTEHSLPKSQNTLTRLANRVTHPRNDLTIAVSHDVAGAISGRGMFGPRRLRVIHGGLDRNRLDAVTADEVARAHSSLGIPDDHQVVGNLAHLRAQKGLEVFLDAAGLIAASRSATSFVVVGREKQAGIQEGLQAHAERLGIADRTHFAGFQPDPYPYLAMFDVFMMSSHYEGFPIALIEAMAMGKPVVATRVGGVPEAVSDGEDGVLTDPGDAGALAEAVLGLLENEDERERLGQNAARTARDRFSIEAMVRQIESAYDEVLR